MPLGGINYVKTFYEMDTCGQFTKNFGIIYAAIGILPIFLTQVRLLGALIMQKHFMNLIPEANLLKLFWHNLHCYQHIVYSFDMGCVARSIHKLWQKVLWN
jgi:hypothetical protein